MWKVKDIPEDKIVFYDIETDSVYAPYCKLEMLAYQRGVNGEPLLVDLESKRERKAFAALVGDPDILKVSFNGINFDDIVLWRNGMWVNPRNRHDMYLALKTTHPTFPSYSLKAANLLIDMEQSIEDAWHDPEYELHLWLAFQGLEMDFMYAAPKGHLEAYCKHDVTQTCNVFRALWEIVQRKEHWEPYISLELAMGEPLHEMILLGREYIDLNDIKMRIEECEIEKKLWIKTVSRWTNGEVSNAMSNKQMTEFMYRRLKVEFAISEFGRKIWTKSDKLQRLDPAWTKDMPKYTHMLRQNVHDRSSTGGVWTASQMEGLEKNFRSNIRELEDKPLDERLTAASYALFDITKVSGYYRSYLRAGEREQRRIRIANKRQNSKVHNVNSAIGTNKGGNRRESNRDTGNHNEVSIPKSYYLSSARTRRFRSSSKYGINWQNQNKRSKIIQLVPRGWLGFWLDSTQIENVTHIWASDDDKRRDAYIIDTSWNEYVWLTNEIVGGENKREILDKMTSDVNPAWSVYKQYKTVKLALNFGMGPDKFARITGLDKRQATILFERVHQACPAIRKLQRIVKNRIDTDGYIVDPFGHRYGGDTSDIYKVVAYLIQGCGTGSIPKAMTVANFKSIHNNDSRFQMYRPNIWHPYTKMYSFAVLTGTTHDECAGRISLGMPVEKIVRLIRDLMYNMEGRFSDRFGLPLRAKLSLSRTNAAEAEEINHYALGFEGFEEKLRTVIKAAKEACGIK